MNPNKKALVKSFVYVEEFRITVVGFSFITRGGKIDEIIKTEIWH